MTTLQELIKRRDNLLKEKPELVKFQEKINKTLEKIGNNPADRIMVLSLLLQQSIKNLQIATGDLKKLVPKPFINTSNTN